MRPIEQVLPSWGAPTLAEFDTQNVAEGMRLRGSRRQLVRFYNKTESEVYTVKAQIDPKTGSSKPLVTAVRPISREFVLIVTPGDTNTYDGPAMNFHKREHWREYSAFRQGKTAPVGTDLDECSNFVSPHVATELKYLGCHTLEQLADSSDMLCSQIANGWELREYAKAIVKANTENHGNRQVLEMRAQLERSNDMILRMQKEMNDLRSQILDQHGNPLELKPIEPLIKPEVVGLAPVLEVPEVPGVPGMPVESEVEAISPTGGRTVVNRGPQRPGQNRGQ